MHAKIAPLATVVLAGLLCACGGGKTETAAPAKAEPAKVEAPKKEAYEAHEPGGLPGLADALKGDAKKDEAKPAEAPKPAEPTRK
jgi:hypothetical protein